MSRGVTSPFILHLGVDNMNRTEKREKNKLNTLRLIVYMLCLFISATSVFYAKMVTDENKMLRDNINSNREIPLSVKEELGLR